MGLAYDLDSKKFPNLRLNDWSYVLFQGDSNLFLASGGPLRVEGIDIPQFNDANYDEFDIIIRSTTYAQDYYVVTGSYRAFFQELNGGAGAWAWDGFVTFIRAHNIGMVNPFLDVPDPCPESFANDPTKFWLTPGVLEGGFRYNQPFSPDLNAFFTYLARMPYEVEPDLTGIGSDSTPGIYAIDQVKASTIYPEFRITAGGHQRIAASEGMTSSQNYSGWITQLIFAQKDEFVIGLTENVPGGRDTTQPYRGLEFLPAQSFTASWKGDSANHIGRYLATYPAKTNTMPHIRISIENVARGINTTTTPYTTYNFDLLTTVDNGYYISRIHDLVVTNGGPFPLLIGEASLQFQRQCIAITGEAIADDGGGGVSFTTPYVAYWQRDNAPPPVGTGLADLYTSLGNKNWGLDASIPAYNLNGAYGTVLIPTVGIANVTDLTNMAIGVDNVTHGATTSAEIYVANFQYVLGAFDMGAPNFTPAKSETVYPFAVKGGGFETATGFTLPEKWLGKAIQQATYLRTDEEQAKNYNYYIEWLAQSASRESDTFIDYQAYEDRSLLALLESDPTLGKLQPDPINYLVPFRPPNFYQYGYGINGPSGDIGLPVNLAYGLLGFSTGTGPVIIMYDYGTLNMYVTNTNPITYGIGSDAAAAAFLGQTFDTISVGNSINAAIVNDSSSTTRKPVSARWDADRDQWIFTFADSGGGSLVSCNSAFNRQPPTQIAYLDQTDQFEGIDSDSQSSLYISRNMTPFLDGLVLFGGALETNNKGQAAITSIEMVIPNPPFEGGTRTVRGFQPYVIQGTTGREARVWVDYLLFDGVDSMVATELQSLGLRVTVENVEWYKAKILKAGKTGITPEEIEDWVRSQQTEYRETLKLKERQGRLRTRRRQQAAWREGLEDTISGDFQETTGFESLESLDTAAETFVPSPSDSAPISGNKSKKHSSIQKSKADKKRD